MSEEIIIDVSPAGNVKIDAQGFAGVSCAKATEEIELVLGGGQKKKTPKPEYYMPATEGQHIEKSIF